VLVGVATAAVLATGVFPWPALAVETVPWPAIVTGIFAGVATAVFALRRPALPSALVRARVHTAVVVAALAVLLVTVFRRQIGVGGTVPTAAFLTAMVAAGAFAVVTSNRHAARLLDGEPIVEWTARLDRRYGWLGRAGSVVLALAALAIGSIFPAVSDTGLSIGLAGVFAVSALVPRRQRTYRLFENGLLVNTSNTVDYRFVPLSRLRSVRLTDDVLSIRRRLPWPFPLRSERPKITEVETIAAAIRERIGG